jgi:ribonucleoside-triphosphate reductase
MTERFTASAEHREFLETACRVAADKGNPCFCFDRGESHPACFGLQAFAENREGWNEPWTIRSFNLHNISINLPRLAYKAKGDDALLISMLDDVLELTVKAHVQKKNFLDRLLSFGENGPLSLLTMNHDGCPYFRMDKTSCLVGMVGLNELLLLHKGRQLHENEEAVSFGLNIVEHIGRKISHLGEEAGLHLSLGQSHAETTAYRFARLDLKYYSPAAGRTVRGNLAKGEIYYTNSTHLNVSSPVDPATRISVEGRFHPLFTGGAVTNIWLGSEPPASGVLCDILMEAFKNSKSFQVIFSPEFTICSECRRTSRGFSDDCSFCGSVDVDVIARITQYFSRVSDWNKGKLAELMDRNRNEAFLR